MFFEHDELKRINGLLEEQIEESRGTIRLLSELHLDPEDEEFVRGCHRSLVNYAVSGYASGTALIVAYHLMDLGKNNYKDRNFWTAVGCAPAEQAKVGYYFRQVVDRYGLASIKSASRINVDNILFHAFIPEEYISQYFDFVAKFFNIYLGREIHDDLDERIKIISKLVTRSDVEVYPGFKSMMLIKTTKMILEDPVYYTRFTSKLIHRFANDYEDFEEVRLGSYEDSFKKWLERQYADRTKKSSLNINSPPFISYNINNHNLYLVVPERTVSATDDKINILDTSGKTITWQNLYKTKQFDVNLSEQTVFEIKWDPLSDYRVVIGNKTIFRNTDKNHLLLNSKGILEKKLTRGYNLAIVRPEEMINLEFSEMSKKKDYKVIGFRAEKGTELEITGYRYIIEVEATENIQLISDYVDIPCRDNDDVIYSLFSKPPQIRLTVSDNKNARFRLTITNLGLPLDFQSVSELKQSSAAHIDGDDIILDLSKTILGNRNGLFLIKSNGRESFRFVVANGFSYKFDKESYDTLMDSVIDYKLGDRVGQIKFSTSQGIVSIPEYVGGMELRFEIPVPSYRYSFDKKNWVLFNGKTYHIRDICDNTPIFINCPNAAFPKLYVDFAPDKGIDLEYDGEYLQCSTHPIVTTAKLIEFAGYSFSSLILCCDYRRIMKVVFHADYRVEGNTLHISNRCEDTETILVFNETGEEQTLNEDLVELPLFKGKLTVLERFDDGFDCSDHKIMEINNDLAIDSEAILRGDSVENFEFSVGQIKCSFHGNPFAKYYGTGRMMNATVPEPITDFDEETTYRLYNALLSIIKSIVCSDDNSLRVATRMRYIRTFDPKFALELGESFLSRNKDPLIQELVNRFRKFD